MDANKIKEQALKEVEAEDSERAVELYKSKLKELKAARQVVKNIERELDDLNDQIQHGVY